jgi:hypothetical protein
MLKSKSVNFDYETMNFDYEIVNFDSKNVNFDYEIMSFELLQCVLGYQYFKYNYF